MDAPGLMQELVPSGEHDEVRAGDEVEGLEDAVNTGLADEVALGVGDVLGQLPGRELRLRERGLHHCVFRSKLPPVPV